MTLDVRDFGFDTSQLFATALDTQRAEAIQRTVDSLGINGGTVSIPAGYHRISKTILVERRSGVSITGQRGDGFTNPHTGTTLVWAGEPGGTMLRFNQAGRSSIENINLDGGGWAGIGFHWENQQPVIIGANYLTLRNVNIGYCGKGIQIGRPGENQPNGSECSAYDLTLTGCHDGILWQQDQAGAWNLYNLGLLSNGNGIRTGAAAGDSGNFIIHSGSFGNNRVDLNLPRISNSVVVENVGSERSGTFLLSEGGDNSVGGLAVSLRNVSTHSSVLRPLRFRSLANLYVEKCRFTGGPPEIGNDQGGQATPMRVFRDSVLMDPTLLDPSNKQHIVFENLPRLGLGYLERLYELRDQSGRTLRQVGFDGVATS